MRTEKLDFADTDAIRACHQVYLAVREADDPGGGWLSALVFRGWLTIGWSGDPREAWVARAADGTVIGWYRLEMHDLENQDQADLDLVVHPARRRQGIGRALLRHAMERAVARGQSVLIASPWDGSPGEAFARSAGARSAVVGVRRMQELGALPTLAGLRGEAERAAAGYSLKSWSGLVPDEFVDGVAAVLGALGDAPDFDSRDRPRWDARRVRERVNAIIPRLGLRSYSVAAVTATGEMAALSQMWIDPFIPDWGFQGFTAVVKEHRGHRLGLLTKIAMLDLLATTEPQLKRIETWNAAPNSHMIAVNEALGYHVSGPPATHWELDL